MKKYIALLSVAVLVSALGCGSGGPAPSPRYEVKGTVTWKDAPVADAKITFFPEGSGEVASAQTDAQGNYTVKAVEGPHKVALQKIDANAAAAAGAAIDSVDQDPSEAQMVPVDEGKSKHLLPAKYSTPSSTTLKADVNAEGENKFDFTLEGPPGGQIEEGDGEDSDDGSY